MATFPDSKALDTMRALTVEPGVADSLALQSVPEPPLTDGPVLVRTLAVGVCGTDIEIIEGHSGSAPQDSQRLILGHESIGEVLEAGPNSGFDVGDLIAGIVRRPDHVPCAQCAAGQWDMCSNGLYIERGIKESHGFASDLFRIRPEYAVKLPPELRSTGVLLEPTSVVSKGWDQVLRIGQRQSEWKSQTALVLGAGPIGLLAALVMRQAGVDVHVHDRVLGGVKQKLVEDIGAIYHGGAIPVDFKADVVMECTGVGALAIDVAKRLNPGGVACLLGVPSGSQKMDVDVAELARTLVFNNVVIFGSVNANRSHWESSVETLKAASTSWLEALITRRVPLDQWEQAFVRHPDDVKVVVDFTV